MSKIIMCNDLIKKTFDFSNHIDIEGLSTVKFELNNSIDYYIKAIKNGDDILKKYYIIDTRAMSLDAIKFLFNNFQLIQREILSDDFFRNSGIDNKDTHFIYPLNLELIFLGDRDSFNFINKDVILNDMNYALKSFMSESQLYTYINKQWNFDNIGTENVLQLCDHIIKLNHFNYIVGNNASGKTTLLKEISDKIDSPVVNMNDNDYYAVHNIIAVQQFIYNLAGSSFIDEYSSYGKYVKRLAQILQYSIENGNVVLLDDLNWNSLSPRSFVRLINTLADYSYEHNSVVLTGYNKDDFIKKKVYKPNIISMNSY